MTEPREPGRTGYEARFTGFPLGPRGISPAWEDLGPEARAIWAGVEAAVLRTFLEPTKALVEARAAERRAVAAEAVNEALEAGRRATSAINRLEALAMGEGA
ncbi:hypothetical protein [Methylobacterium oxalidis]|uniref:Uncharacterized protein n=1 Tax=Methylobacterium oxalidis TaxID=944322 RepID=A0A512J0S6_9HYPH|nr:hypothetical protein [Methylobacterium oxalidis]GEP03578.1 hypothetical protein MOX02_16160 [Methylobacterium oxalidis]GJE34282.1 hypothetical protein LDDCCGHA_4492 [Methylobacterium oxalidis]GLS64905.1 hypothetical protein GCM10007888_32860 [Methylobacterium oxalidis]